jgi:hypothetical protein
MRGIGRGLGGFWGSLGSEFFFVWVFCFALFWAVSCFVCGFTCSFSISLFFVAFCSDADVEWSSTGILIIIFEKDMFDYKSGEPPENYLTVLRALEVRFFFL